MDPFDLRTWNGFKQAKGDLSKPAWIEQVVIDSRRIHSTQSLFVALTGTRMDGHQFIDKAASQGAKYALVKKGFPPCKGISLLYVDEPLLAFQEIVQTYRQSLPTYIIAIAGSYGKTMVKDLLHKLLETTYSIVSSPESFNSQIGVPLSLLQVNSQHKIALIEASFSQPGEAAALAKMIQPDATILTHLGNRHIITLGSLEKTAKEMADLLPLSNKQKGAQKWTIAPSHPLLKDYLPQKTFLWDLFDSHLPHAKPLPDSLHYAIDFPKGSSHQLPLKLGCNYFLDLIHLAIKPAYLLGISPEKSIEILRDYTPEPMRTEIWPLPFGATIINETYGSDPQSVDLALRHLSYISPGKTFFFFGGLRNPNPSAYKRVGQAIAQAKIDNLSVYGFSSFEVLLKEVQTLSSNTFISQFDTLEEAIAHHRPLLRADDRVLIKGAHKTPFEHINEAFQGSISSNQCLIHLGAIAANLKLLRKRLPLKTRLMVMVKALAYGTSDTHMARFLASQGIDLLGVSYIDEAIALRRSGVKQNLFVLNAAPYEAEKAAKWGFEIAVSDAQMIALLEEKSKNEGKRLSIHLHIDTGMNRLGCRPEEALELAKKIGHSSSLHLEGVMTHFACADRSEEDFFTLEQAHRFDQAIKTIEEAGIPIPWKHAANSSSALRFSFPHYNMVRLGMAIYGLVEDEGTPAISLISRIVGINRCKKGETISYGRNYRVEKEWEKIAVIPIGYFDGIHLNYSGKGEVMIRGKNAPMVGKICMDYLMVNVTHIPEATIGDPVLLFGEDEEGHFLSPSSFAAKGESNVYELITCLGPRIQRVFIHEEDHRMC